LNTPEKHDRYLFNTDEKDTTDVNEDESETELEEEIIDDFDNVRSTDSNVSADEENGHELIKMIFCILVLQ